MWHEILNLHKTQLNPNAMEKDNCHINNRVIVMPGEMAFLDTKGNILCIIAIPN